MRAVALLSAVMMAAGPVAAQDDGDWDLVSDPENDSLIAVLSFDVGPMIALRCSEGAYAALITGLPPAPEGAQMVSVGIKFADGPEADWRFNTTEHAGTLIADFPAPLARNFRQGGPIELIVHGGALDGRNLRYALDVPASHSAINQTLAACDRPLVDPRDALLRPIEPDGLPAAVRWLRRPTPRYPQGRTYTRGFAVISCITQPDGRVSDCEVEAEFPLGGGFGRAAVAGSRSARVESTAGEVGGIRLGFRVNFAMSGE